MLVFPHYITKPALMSINGIPQLLLFNFYAVRFTILQRHVFWVYYLSCEILIRVSMKTTFLWPAKGSVVIRDGHEPKCKTGFVMNQPSWCSWKAGSGPSCPNWYFRFVAVGNLKVHCKSIELLPHCNATLVLGSFTPHWLAVWEWVKLFKWRSHVTGEGKTEPGDI